jgi:hypothetical protein
MFAANTEQLREKYLTEEHLPFYLDSLTRHITFSDEGKGWVHITA